LNPSDSGREISKETIFLSKNGIFLQKNRCGRDVQAAAPDSIGYLSSFLTSKSRSISLRLFHVQKRVPS